MVNISYREESNKLTVAILENTERPFQSRPFSDSPLSYTDLFQ